MPGASVTHRSPRPGAGTCRAVRRPDAGLARESADGGREWRRRDRQDHVGRGSRSAGRGTGVHRRCRSLSGHRGRHLVRAGHRGRQLARHRGRGSRVPSVSAAHASAARPADAPELRTAPPARRPAPHRARGRRRRAGAAGAGGPALGGCLDAGSRCHALAHRSRSSAPGTDRADRRPASPAPRAQGTGRDQLRPGRPARRRRSAGPGQHRRHRGGGDGWGGRSGEGPVGPGPFGGQPALRRGDRRRRAGDRPRAAGRPVPDARRRLAR